MNSEFITLVANLALTFSFIVAVIFGIAQVKSAARDRNERFTLETLRNFQTREFSELIHFITRGKIPDNNADWEKLPEENRIMFIQFGQQMESLGILVAEKLIDVDLVDKTLGSFIVTSWEKYLPLFNELRTTDEFLGEYFQWLAELIKKRMKENPRKPFYENKILLK